ncbi:hypothetical protein R8Z50_29645 [Longispora sp. K20-0274]|uniref:hypothetical protein n=1 Tax=Longispora sp. K20-0274 TaxID=3088255 RepID=UPI00399A9430
MNRDVHRVRDLLGPADPARSAPVGPGDPTGLVLDPAIDITPDSRAAPDPSGRRVPRWALAGAFAAVLATAGAVAVVTRPGIPETSPGGAPCLNTLATAAVDAPSDGQPGRYLHLRIRAFSGPLWMTPSDHQLWTEGESSGRYWLQMDPVGVDEDPRNAPNANALLGVRFVDRSGTFTTRAARTDFLRALAANPEVRCAGDLADPLGRTGLAVTARPGAFRAVPGTPPPIEEACKPAFSPCQSTLIFDKHTGELLADLESDPAAAPGRVAYRTYSDRSRTDTMRQL